MRIVDTSEITKTGNRAASSAESVLGINYRKHFHPKWQDLFSYDYDYGSYEHLLFFATISRYLPLLWWMLTPYLLANVN